MGLASPFKFKQTKSIQAVAFLLKQKHRSRSDNYMRLLKLLYIADRESIEETGVPITGDEFVAMERGPTLSHLLNLVKQQTFGLEEWDEYIEKNNYEIHLIKDPGVGKLCRYELKKLRQVWEDRRDKDEWDVARETEQFPEWQKNECGPSSRPIPLGDLLDAIGKRGLLEQITQNAIESIVADKLFGTDC